MSKAKKILGTEEAWENGELGNNLESARVAPPELKKSVEDALAMQMISIRLPKSVIDDFKLIAEFEGIGYQPLMREALMRFAECEAKRIMREVVSERRRDSEIEQAHQKKAA
jgi:predicted DNA binding CopG/RHH family protein